MDDFNNFFDEDKYTERERTPIYHTPDQTPPPGGNKKTNVWAVVSIVFAAMMCIVVIINVVVLATLKDSIAGEYAAKMAQELKNQYSEAVNDALNDKNIVEDVIDNATNSALDKLTSSMTEKVREECWGSVAEITSIDSAGNTYVATGFLISDADANGNRYFVTNAHVVMYESKGFMWKFYPTIRAKFDNDSYTYTLKVVAVGGYKEGTGHIDAYNSQADLAICTFSGKQPDETLHPSLKIAAGDYAKEGDEVVLIGNPAGYGLSMSSGIICSAAKEISNWGAGSFILTDAALNGGNSGGPMINKNCVVVGVSESKLVREDIDNMGFAVSAQTLVNFIEWAQNPDNATKGSIRYETGRTVTIPYTTVSVA